MKNYFLRNCTFATILLASTLTLTSCGDDEEENKPGTEFPDEPVKPNEPGEQEALTPYVQKQRMEEIAKEAMNMAPASDFKAYSELANFVNDVYGNDYDWSNVDDWAKQCWNDVKKATGNKKTETGVDYWGWSTCYNIYTEYKSLLLASNFTGHFNAGRKKWTKDNGRFNDLQFTFSGQNGEECVLKLETSGKVTKVNVGSWDEWKDYEDRENASFNYYDRINCTIGVPENIVLTLTQGGKQLVKTTVNVALSNLDGMTFDIAKGNVSVTANVELDNGYTFSSSQVNYAGNSKLSVASASVKKGGKVLVTVSMAGDVSGLPSCNVDAFSKDNFSFDDYNTDNTTMKNAFVKVDVLGKLQVQGVISDVRQYSDALDMAAKQDENETAFKSFVKKANSLADINLFYDNSSVKQATVMMDTFVDYEYNGKQEWGYEPVIVFYDGSSNSALGTFFSERNFKSVIRMYESLLDDYEQLLK